MKAVVVKRNNGLLGQTHQYLNWECLKGCFENIANDCFHETLQVTIIVFGNMIIVPLVLCVKGISGDGVYFRMWFSCSVKVFCEGFGFV